MLRAADFPNNPFGTKEAVVNTAARICRDRDLELTPEMMNTLVELDETVLLDAVLRLAREPDYRFEDEFAPTKPVLH